MKRKNTGIGISALFWLILVACYWYFLPYRIYITPPHNLINIVAFIIFTIAGLIITGFIVFSLLLTIGEN